jgi:Putative 8-oxoguanine DNA glycosylase OGG-like protein
VVYECDEQARQEAAAHTVSDDEAARLREQCTRKASDLGDDGVRGHTVSFSAMAWDEPPGLPDSVPRTGRISRRDVLHIGDRVHAGTLPATDLFAASFVWGWGTTGYGPRRYRDIRIAAGVRLESSLQRALAEINENPGSPDPIAGYAHLYGGHDYENRAAPGQEPWSRLQGFGPAFFTKFLYFSTPGALILDNRLANAVYNQSRLPYLVTGKGRSLAWTPYRYAVYLHWMGQSARAAGVEPEILEFTLFQPPKDLNDEHVAAD